MIYKKIIKRIFDVSVASFILLIFMPILIVLTVLLYFANQGKPIFYQKRPGKNGVIFRLIKFKSMNDKRNRNGNLLPDRERLTKVGNFIRKNSLDELPQLLNVLKGDMSLIGPRPLLIEYLPLYNDKQARRHEVKPGITGWAQVNGRNAISWEDKFEYDVYYVDHLTFFTDMKILYKTIINVVKRKDINSSEEVTMERFVGNVEKTTTLYHINE